MLATQYSRPRFPHPDHARSDGLLAIGGDLEPATLLEAYRMGIFPWYGEGSPILWWAPDPRMVLFPDEFHASRRLRRRLRQPRFRCSWDTAFDEVIATCASIPRKGEPGTWILPEMMRAYRRLHALGYAHSIEIRDGDALIGGVYGVLLEGIFFAESMFSRATDGSKMALAHLCQRALDAGWQLIDCQFYTEHLASLGAREIPRREFLEFLPSGMGGC